MDFDDLDIDINKNFIIYNTNDIYLTEEQVDILNFYNIDYRKCKSVSELISLIERNKDDDNYDDLDWVSSNLSDFNYYHNTNK